MREFRLQKHGTSPYSGEPTCTRCRARGTVYTIDVEVSKIPADREGPEVPAGWCALIALCSDCLDKLGVLIAHRTLIVDPPNAPNENMDDIENKK